ncbi:MULTISPECIES: RIP metalloprotease RseP [Rhodomicrobium]|uniref:RIP metalloprotease RseP n=1 Tax=Rhodomicrobium TaxID=1068 RepID=UPI000B4A99E0|nr:MULTISPECIES: RIP metalloprotease RseP [Rhodomicrobium]
MTNLADTAMWTGAWYYLSWVVPFLFVLGVVVFVHEMGHFLVARFFGVSVEAFSIGFGPEIGGFYDRYGTRWRLAWVPLGGYVKFKGDENAASVPSQGDLAALSPEERAGNFHAKPVYQRAAVVAAGPLANFLLAIVILTAWFIFMGKPILEPRVATVEPDSAAAEAGFQPGDVIRGIDGTNIQSFDDIQRIVMLNAETPLHVTVDRNGQPLTLVATPKLKETKDRFGNLVQIGLLGIGRKNEDVTYKQFGPVEAFSQSLSETYFWMKQPLVFIQKLAVGQASGDQVRGVVGIAQLSREVASIGFVELFRWIAIISINIGLLNLFPIPMLDGGHLLFYGIEAIRGRPLSERVMEIGFRIGFALVIMLMLFATRNDVIHLIRQMG